MNKPNYDVLMQNEIALLGDSKPTLLLHACCAPCSTACLERLREHFVVTILFYNPNIEDEEYFKRKEEMIHYLAQTGGESILDCDRDKALFYELAKGLEHVAEGGERCKKCYALRLNKTAELAEANGFDYFATTLTVSPLKNATWINELGHEAAQVKKTKWLYTDFKKRGGYLLSTQKSKEYNLYRQNYCGCVYSLAEAKQREQNALQKS